MMQAMHPSRPMALLLAACVASASGAAGDTSDDALDDAPLYAQKTPRDRADDAWLQVFLERVPPLQHARGTRWPMICWESAGLDPLPPETVKALLARGLTQHIRFDTNLIRVARALQDAGSPVIMVQGAGGNWPARLAGPEERWAHQFDEGYTREGPWIGACPMMREGWGILGDQVRATLRGFRDAGVTVDAMWMDWEGDPLYYRHLFGQLRHCRRCREQLPEAVYTDRDAWLAFYWKLYLELNGAYLAGPALEIFPRISLTNWQTVYSTPEHPVITWSYRTLPPGTPTLFNASNPVAYGNDVSWGHAWKSGWRLTRRNVDRFYTHMLLLQVSADAANRAAYAPHMDSFPWVCRWCPDVGDPSIPVMSREAYREVLRHIWLRGADGMQIFNPKRRDYEEMAVLEVLDAVAVYDEMLAYREFLDGGATMCTDVPPIPGERPYWSGLRLADRALVRIVAPGPGTAEITLQPWDGIAVTLTAPPEGRTLVLSRSPNGIEAASM
jgi:hypothetical protein